MNAEVGIGAFRVGEWQFMPATGELLRGSEARRLEPRAAKMLQLLCEARGAIVTQETLIAEIWNGRTLSDNSVAVVIAQLRRALDDDAREPRLIETMPKRGYRLMNVEAAPEQSAKKRPVVLLAGLALLALLLLAVFTIPRTRSPHPAVSVSDVINQTGDARYDPLARATSELIVADLAKRGFDVDRHGQQSLALQSKLVIWNGGPSLGITATDEQGLVRWSAMMDGSPAAVPRAVASKLDDFAAKFRER